MKKDKYYEITEKMSKCRIVGWHAALFPTGYSGMYKINVGNYRTDEFGLMQVVSVYTGKEKVIMKF